jgi:hypothetical protein
MQNSLSEKLGEPQIHVRGLNIWVHGWCDAIGDGNWLNVTVECSCKGQRRRAYGPLIHMLDLKEWADEADDLNKSLTGDIFLAKSCGELQVLIKLKNGKGTMSVEFGYNPWDLEPEFTFQIDHNYLPDLSCQCRRVLANVPKTTH